MQFNSSEIFAGAGGLAIGAHLAGFRCGVMLDSSKHVCDTLRYNKFRGIPPMKHAEIIETDIRGFQFSDLASNADIIVGGPPCQPFSQGGKRRHHFDERNMFPEAVRAIREVSPRAFLFENVKGLATGQNRNYAELIKLQLQFPNYAADLATLPWEEQLAKLEYHSTACLNSDFQYNVIVHSLNSADFGVPQKRERIFFAGFRNDLGINWNFPPPTHSNEALKISQLKKGEYWERHRVPKKHRVYSQAARSDTQKAELLPWRTTRDAICDLPDVKSSHAFSQHIYYPGARSYRGHTGSHWDQPSKTLKAGAHGVPGGENMLRQYDGSVRYFTIRECLRLQTFPDDFEDAGPRSEQIRQIGNAVPCLLAEKLLTSIKTALSDKLENY